MLGKRQALLHHQVFLVSENSAAKQKKPVDVLKYVCGVTEGGS